MKLKYYLRGLGTGIIFTVIVLTIIFAYRNTDKKIMEKARDLGMVEKSELENGEKKTEDANVTASTENKVSSAEDSTSTEPQKESDSEASTENTTEPSTTEPTTTEAATTEPPTTEAPTTEAPTTEVSTTGGTATVYVAPGSTSERLCENMQALGLIDNAYDFNKYLCESGQAVKIQAGEFKLPYGASYEELARMLQRK